MTPLEKILTFILIIVLFGATAFLATPDNLDEKLAWLQKIILDDKITDAEKVLHEILKKEAHHPRANLLKAFLLLKKGDRENRIAAYDLIRKYSPRAQDWPFTHFVNGYLLKTGGKRYFAAKHFERALQVNPYFIEALVELGELYYQEMLSNIHRISDTEIPISFQDYSYEDFDKAVMYLKKALDLEPYHERALFLLGILYYETDQIDEMIRLYRWAVETHPENTSFHLFLGLAYQRHRDYVQARKYFDQALYLMSDTDRELFLNPQHLFSDQNQPSEFSGGLRFWADRDPLLLTDENERLLEHFARMAYVNLRFGVPRLNILGWKTDRGKVFLRYGKPLKIIFYAKDLKLFEAIYPPTEIWYYDNFYIAFEDLFWNGNFQFAAPDLSVNTKSMFRSRARADFTLVAENIFREIPESFDFQLPGGKFNTRFKFSFFKGPQQTTEILWTYDIPLKEFNNSSDLRLETGLFFWKDSIQNREDFREAFRLKDKDKPAIVFNGSLWGRLNPHLPAGHYKNSFELIEHYNQKVFIHRGEVVVPDFTKPVLQMSDILLSSRIRPTTIRRLFIHNKLFILPTLDNVFKAGQKMYLYFEIYHLRSGSDGMTDYVVENSIMPMKGGGILSKIFKSEKKRVSLVNEYRGQSEDDFVVQAIQLENLSPGKYWLEIKVTDLLTHQTTSRRQLLQIAPSNSLIN